MNPPENLKEMPSNQALSKAGRSRVRIFAAGCIVASGLVLLVVVYAQRLTPDEVTERDYMEYWAAGHQLVHHADPYDFAAAYQLEKQNGMQTDEPRISFSPPVALEAELPLGWLGAKAGLIVWLMAELGCVLVSIWLLWRLCGRPDSRLQLLGLAFAPVVACQMSGQIGAFFLLCLVLFLEFHRTRPFLAGVALMPFALKPHLVVPFAIALVIWCLVSRSFAVIAGGTCALAASCAASLAIDPHAWKQYSRMLASFPLVDWFVPTVGMALRFWIHPSARWLGYIPEAGACAWAAWYAWKHRGQWDWMKHGQLVMAVSVACAPYSWISDQCVILPAVLAVLWAAARSNRALLLFLLINGVMLTELFMLPTMTSHWYIWSAALVYLVGAGMAGVVLVCDAGEADSSIGRRGQLTGWYTFL
ncbi:MAG TPA: glycosyltransferase 87 family protein [Terracidiphilus sp.]|jgi:hypothetical protein|nr:glycosyltransferase 87 family protein [Terracidiphilus sp.]